MTPLGLSVATWWWIAVLVTAVFWAIWVPSMPTREYRIMTVLAPFGGALVLLAHYEIKGMDPADALSMFSTAILSFGLGAVGHRRKLAQRLMEAKREGRSDRDVMPVAMMGQILLSLTAGMVVYFCIKP
ncbi:hypothetical protein ACIRYZ_18520 [Kitasatospora sp. NPDC101155]|uniref:hypothetical protein n=1 Tax=Kitasatospora sp. NPDC101155 TaxID=3364097 RepID=UPI0037F13BFB